jgi:hypothetical protein
LKDLDVKRWEHDLWWLVVLAALRGQADIVDLHELPGFERPAVSRYGATTPRLVKWFKRFNSTRVCRERVRPYGFLLAYQAGHGARPVSPFDKDHQKALQNVFDRETGEKIATKGLKTYAEALRGYHLHPESKFLNADYFERGVTRRRHIQVAGVEYIGKEANKWEEQYFTGLDVDAQIEYGRSDEELEQEERELIEMCRKHGPRKVARASGLSHTHVRRVVLFESSMSARTRAALRRAKRELEAWRTET